MAAAIIPGLIAAAGSIGGGIAGQPGTPPATKKIGNRDPLLNALSVDALLALGVPIDSAFLQKASPLGNLSGTKVGRDLLAIVNRGQAAGLSIDEIMARIERAGKNKSGTDDILGSLGVLANETNLQKILTKTGYSSLRDLVQADIEFSQAADARASRIGAVQPGIEQGRLDALGKIAGLQSGFVAPTEADIRSRSGEIETALRGQISREAADQQAAALVAAQVGRFNPGGAIGRLGEWQSQANLEAGPDSIARALQLLSGEQGLQSNALSALLSSLQPATVNASNLLGMRMNQNASVGNQALQGYGIQAQGNQALGGAINEGFGSVANAMTLAQLMKQFGGGDDTINASGAGSAMNLLNANYELGSRG